MTDTERDPGGLIAKTAERLLRRWRRERHPSRRPRAAHRSFALILAGGGARGLAHVGVLRALEHYGWQPSAIVGVSMGAIVGATYALNPDWYHALVNMDTRDFPEPPVATSKDLRARIRALLASEQALRDMFLGWGVGSRSLQSGKALLHALTRGRDLQEGRIPVAVVATDLNSGQRVVLREGNAAEAVYASAALPGILPPLAVGKRLLADGAYADLVPVDVARAFGAERVIAVDPRQLDDGSQRIRNGFQAMVRAMEICQYQHGEMRFQQADLVLKPEFPFLINALDFRHKAFCVAQGVRAVRRALPELRRLLQMEQ